MRKEERSSKNARVSPSGSWVFILSLMVLAALSLVVSHCGPTPEPTVSEVHQTDVVTAVIVPTAMDAPVLPPGSTPFDNCYESQDAGGLVCEAVEGVTVTLPWDYKPGDQWLIAVVKLPLEQEGPVTKEELEALGLLSNGDDFLPSRLVINFEIVDASTGELLTYFDPPIRLRVALTEEEQRYPELALGFWDEVVGRWVAFGDSKHSFFLEGGFGYATLTGWGDRRIAAGEPY
jgi:hypothetical protein